MNAMQFRPSMMDAGVHEERWKRRSAAVAHAVAELRSVEGAAIAVVV